MFVSVMDLNVLSLAKHNNENSVQQSLFTIVAIVSSKIAADVSFSAIQHTMGMPKKQNPAKPKKAISAHPTVPEPTNLLYNAASFSSLRKKKSTAFARVFPSSSHSSDQPMVGRVHKLYLTSLLIVLMSLTK